MQVKDAFGQGLFLFLGYFKSLPGGAFFIAKILPIKKEEARFLGRATLII